MIFWRLNRIQIVIKISFKWNKINLNIYEVLVLFTYCFVLFVILLCFLFTCCVSCFCLYLLFYFSWHSSKSTKGSKESSWILILLQMSYYMLVVSTRFFEQLNNQEKLLVRKDALKLYHSLEIEWPDSQNWVFYCCKSRYNKGK